MHVISFIRIKTGATSEDLNLIHYTTHLTNEDVTDQCLL